MSTATNLQRSNFNNLANVIDYTFTQKMFDLNTLMVCVFNNYDNTIPEYAQVTQLINNIDVYGNPLSSPFQFYVPIGYIMGGNAGIHITYKSGDLVLVGYSQQSLSALKNAWAIGNNKPNELNPLNYGKFTLEDGIILCKISATLPTTIIDIQETGITITSNDKPVTINAGTSDTIINSTNVTLNTTNKVNIVATNEIDLTAPTINLNGNVTSTGTINTPSISINGHDYANHTHSGVQTGGGNTGPVNP